MGWLDKPLDGQTDDRGNERCSCVCTGAAVALVAGVSTVMVGVTNERDGHTSHHAADTLELRARRAS